MQRAVGRGMRWQIVVVLFAEAIIDSNGIVMAERAAILAEVLRDR